jgi:AcrR family transcriptional regulator
MVATSTRARLPRDYRKEQVLVEARALFGERGYAAVTMEEIAAAVGVTKPLLYNYFGNKERLYVACMEPVGDALTAAIAEAVEATDTPGQALVAGARAFFAFLDAERGAWAVLFDETQPHVGEVADRVAVYRSAITDLVTRSMLAQMPEGRWRAALTEVEALSVALLGAAEALARWWLRTGDLSAEAAAELLISTVAPGLAARSTPTASQPPEEKRTR